MKSYKLDGKKESDKTRPAKDKPGSGTPVCEGWAAGDNKQEELEVMVQ